MNEPLPCGWLKAHSPHSYGYHVTLSCPGRAYDDPCILPPPGDSA